MLYDYISNSQRKKTSIFFTSEERIRFSVIWKFVLSQTILFLKEIESSSSRDGLNIYHSDRESVNKLSGFHTETGLLGMLEATNFNSIDTVSSFSGATANHTCGNGKNAPKTKAFTRYIDNLQTIYKRGLRIGWTEPEPRSLSKSIQNFKGHAQSVFEPYQASSMGTSQLCIVFINLSIHW